jgi:hypothetical protein
MRGKNAKMKMPTTHNFTMILNKENGREEEEGRE